MMHKHIRKSPFIFNEQRTAFLLAEKHNIRCFRQPIIWTKGGADEKNNGYSIFQPIRGKWKGHPPISGVGWIGVLCCWFSALEGGVRSQKRSWFGRIYCWVHGWVELISGAVFKLMHVISFRRGLVLQLLDWAYGKR